MSNNVELFLKRFLQDYINWIDTGAPKKDNNFSREQGLCPTLHDYAWGQGLYDSQQNEVTEYMTSLFKKDKLDARYPFNNGDEEAYFREINRNRAHLNKRRIQWVRDHL